ncbi:hypothetical protein CR513_26544, partial [Mucuna pruriens]
MDMTKCKIPPFLGNCNLDTYVDLELKFMDDLKRRGIIDMYENWEALKNIMKARLYQESRSVDEYDNEMEMNLVRAQIRESEEATMARFLHDLNREI